MQVKDFLGLDTGTVTKMTGKHDDENDILKKHVCTWKIPLVYSKKHLVPVVLWFFLLKPTNPLPVNTPKWSIISLWCQNNTSRPLWK